MNCCLAHLLSVSVNHVSVKNQAIHNQRDAALKMNSDTSFPTIFGGHMWQTFYFLPQPSRKDTCSTGGQKGNCAEVILDFWNR